jgi:CelD/BcsL family acetyltransferase involved in cellulose biosynthesis
MEYNRFRGWSSLVVVIYAYNSIVGIVPLVTKTKFGVRFVKFLSGTWPWADFILTNHHRDACIERTLNLLFNTKMCQYVEFTMPSESPNLRILKQKSKAKRLSFTTRPSTGHNTLSINSSWDEFIASKSQKFRKNFRHYRNKLDKAGSWRITSIQSGSDRSDVFRKILDVEKNSWKERWRLRKGVQKDADLLMIWTGAQRMARIAPFFTWCVHFLELNDQTLAYTFVLKYKDVAFMAKTSYHAFYKDLSPGIYVQNAAINKVFNSKRIKKIDFITDLSYLRTWTSHSLPRVNITLSWNGILPRIIRLIRSR